MEVVRGVGGKGRRKKIKEDPSLGGGEDGARGTGAEGTDKLLGNQEHPLMNELVMDVLFKQYSLLSHDDPTTSSLALLAELRLVCKTWNREIGKMIRKETHMNIDRIISAYPEGLGWTVTTSAKDDQDDGAFQYLSPMAQEIGTFEHVSVTIKTCASFNSSSILKWFQLMGSSVKSLRLTCYFTCYHQNRFVERMLKEWCPNLESLTLRKVWGRESLMENSYFAEPSLENQCSSLKEIVLVTDHISCSRYIDPCKSIIEDLETREDKGIQEIGVRKQLHDELIEFENHLMNYLNQAGELSTSVTEEEDLIANLVRRPIGLTSLSGLAPLTYGKHVFQEFFQRNFACDPGYENDGGIIGQLMKMSRVQKLVIQDANVISRGGLNGLFYMIYYRPNLWRRSIQHLEFVGPCPGVIKGIHVVTIPKNIFSKLGFPLKKLKIGDGVEHGVVRRGVMIVEVIVERTLQAYAETLEEVELKMKTTPWYNAVQFPEMPSLKKLVVETDGCRGLKVSGEDVLRKFPMLETCVIKLGINKRRPGQGHPVNLFFEYLQNVGILGNNGGHPLKELKLLDHCVDERDIQRMVIWFPNLESVDLSVKWEAGDDSKAFWEIMRELPLLVQVKLSFSVKLRSSKSFGLCEKAIADNIEGLKGLQWLELVHEAGFQFPVTSELSRHFAKAPKLRVLKLINFQTRFYGRLRGNEAQEIKGNLADVVVQLPANSNRSSARMQMKRKLDNTD